MLAKNAGKFD
jgi:hypothetical protein